MQDTSNTQTSPLTLFRPYQGRLLGLLILIVIAGLLEAIGLLLLSISFNLFLDSRSVGNKLLLLAPVHEYALSSPRLFFIIIGAVYLTKSLCSLWANFVSYSAALRMMCDWQGRFVKDYLHAPLGRLDKQQGAMLQVIMDEPIVVGAGLSAGGVLVQNIFSALSVYAVLLYILPVVTVGLTVVAAAALVVVSILSRYSRKVGDQRSQAITDVYTLLTEMLSALKLLRILHIETDTENRMANRFDKLREVLLKANMIASSPRLLIEAVFLSGLLVLMLVAVPQSGGSGFFPAIATAVAAALRLLPSLSASAGTWVLMHQAWPSLQKIANEFAKIEVATEQQRPTPNLYHPVLFHDRVEVRGVHFTHPGRERALIGVGLEIAWGSVTAIVGPSGSGKSTLVDLLCGLYEPDKGQIIVDGVDLHQVSMAHWRVQLGVVSQDGFLLSGTIRDNLCLLRPDCPEDILREIVALVGADQFIRELPEGYETRVGERGVTLSGGQRQKIALARVLVREPRLLILDEATSALDVESEMVLLKALERLRGRVTMLIIAHRLSTVQHADRIYVLSGGTVIESGLHEELLLYGGLYAAMRRTSEMGFLGSTN